MKGFLFFLLLSGLIQTHAQELFIHTEPASNLPKGVTAVRAFSELYKEGPYLRSVNVLRATYGISPSWTVWAQVNISDHHGRLLPEGFVDDEGGIPHTHDISTGVPLPMLFNGFHFYTKYLFLKKDGRNQHFRMAAFAEGSTSFAAHDEAEPSLLDDNAGVGAGVIMTELYHRFAASLTLGGIVAADYREKDTGLRIRYGRAVNYNLSLGYLLFPFQYKNYKQTNVSLYLEFLGRSSGQGQVFRNEEIVFIGSDTPAFLENHYVEIHPGIQLIFNSNTRLDLGMGFPLINRSYRHTYPLYFLQIQHYFYRNQP
ncbi:MAG: hypothetical protein SF052_08550 [Bacteroidia bacterium]|nr:hypothetical protein [Bacteroidia bacterium]